VNLDWVALPVLFALAATQAGCSQSVRAEVPVVDGLLRPSKATVLWDESGEVILNLPRGSTRSEIGFASYGDGEVCFDVLLRTYAMATPDFEVIVNVDTWNVFEGRWSLRGCTDLSACLPDGTILASQRTDGLVRALVQRGGRFCAASPEPRESMHVELVQGLASLSIDFAIVEP
jgi:hypothetical protein